MKGGEGGTHFRREGFLEKQSLGVTSRAAFLSCGKRLMAARSPCSASGAGAPRRSWGQCQRGRNGTGGQNGEKEWDFVPERDPGFPTCCGAMPAQAAWKGREEETEREEERRKMPGMSSESSPAHTSGSYISKLISHIEAV